MQKNRFFKITFIIAILINLVACSTTSINAVYNSSSNSRYDQENDLPANYPTKSLPDGNLWSDLRGSFDLPVDTDSRAIQAQIRWFRAHQGYLNYVIERGAPYIYYILQETQRRHLPAELVLLPIIESAYNPFLYSKAGATGLWQMMPGTASGFGLKINWWYDGRRDIVASTNAALKYITYLHYFFNNDWLSAIAAYNAGEGKVQSAILHNQRNNLPTDFWSLPLPEETRAYVPKLLALAAIVKNPSRYGVNLIPVNNGQYLEEIDVGSQIDLNQAAKLAGVEVKTMRMLNPGFRRWASDPDGPYKLLVPKDNLDTFKKMLAETPPEKRVSWRKHMVGKKESLVSIAKKYHIDISTLRKINELKSNHVRYQQELLIPASLHIEENSDTDTAKIAEERLPGPRQVVHTVKPGETVNSIAKEYNVKSNEVEYWNQLNETSDVVPDDELVIWQTGAGGKKVAIKAFAYRVKPKDTIYSLAKRFHTKVGTIMVINGMQRKSLRVGQVLKIPGRSKKYSSHYRAKSKAHSKTKKYHQERSHKKSRKSHQ
ncbi:MAG: LysM peptidoglycan-binding domain-containing protein [Gammaproteobacteria bacterium]|nr:LysM peptidoglycan-binding domain-containing protein [Gammaproteobacteria bacterium]